MKKEVIYQNEIENIEFYLGHSEDIELLKPLVQRVTPAKLKYDKNGWPICPHCNTTRLKLVTIKPYCPYCGGALLK